MRPTKPSTATRNRAPSAAWQPFGDLERALLREDNVDRADDWHSVLEAVLARYRDANIRRYFRGGDAALGGFEKCAC